MSDTATPDAPAPVADEAPAERFTVTDQSGTPETTPTGGDDPPAPAEKPAEPAPADPDEPPADPGAEEPQKVRGGFQKRIGELTADKRAAERQVEALTATVRELSAMLTQPHQPQAPQPGTTPPAPQLPPDLAAQVGPPPDPSKFAAGEFDPAYTEAKVMHRLRTEQAAAIVAQRAEASRQAGQEFNSKVRSLVEAGSAKFADFAEVAMSPSVPLPPQVLQEVMECDAPADVVYWLGKNPEEAKRIAGLRPTAVAREMAKIEAKLAAPPSPPEPSKAPAPPPPPLRGRSAQEPSVYDENLSYADYRRLRTGR